MITTTAIVTKVSRQLWFKVNTKPVRAFASDGAVYPHVVTVKFSADGKEYTKRKWLGATKPAPAVGAQVTVSYCEGKPSRATIAL